MYTKKKSTIDLVREVAKKNSITIIMSRNMVSSVLETIMQMSRKDGGLSLRHFGLFSCKYIPEYVVPNPYDSKPSKVGGNNRISFRPGNKFKKVVNS